MENTVHQQVNKRFFEAIQYLKDTKIIRGKKTFTTRYDINPGNFYQLYKMPTKKFPLDYLYYLAVDYGISTNWLITGRGKMLAATKKPN